MNREDDAPLSEPLDEAYPWTGMTCGDCDHAREGPQTRDDVLQRNCYRMPPVAMVIPQASGAAVVTFRPAVQVSTVACGEFEHRYSTPRGNG